MIKTVEESEASHRRRYEWARGKLGATISLVLDIGCGCGYGTYILARQARFAVGVDVDPDAIRWAWAHFDHPKIHFACWDAEKFLAHPDNTIPYTEAVAFEVLEHMSEGHARRLLEALRARNTIGSLFASTPNEETYRFATSKPLGHVRHYRPSEFIRLLHGCGWRVQEMHSQNKKSRDLRDDLDGRYLLAWCHPR